MDRSTQEAQPIAVAPDVAARMIGLGRSKLFELIRDGKLPVSKIGRRTLIPVAALHGLIEQHAEKGRSE